MAGPDLGGPSDSLGERPSGGRESNGIGTARQLAVSAGRAGRMDRYWNGERANQWLDDAALAAWSTGTLPPPLAQPPEREAASPGEWAARMVNSNGVVESGRSRSESCSPGLALPAGQGRESLQSLDR